jgi:hypothetical protein
MSELQALHAEHPHWGSERLGEELDCDPAYVRATFKRKRMIVPSQKKGDIMEATLVERERCAIIAEKWNAPRVAAEIRGKR